MGNKYSCCIYKAPKGHRNARKQEVYQPSSYASDEDHLTPYPSLPQPPSAASLTVPHISEREPDELDGDPSNNPLAKTLFITRSKLDIRKNNVNRRRSQYDNQNSKREYSNLKKFSSCSTIFIDDSTVSQPNLKNTIKAVALAIYFHIRNRNMMYFEDGVLMEIFDEKCHPVTKEPVSEDYAIREPEHKVIYRFIRNLFHAAQLTAECAIVTLVYLERLLMYAEIDIGPSNWKRIVLGAILLASKVWDDQAVWNVDYCQILKDIPVEDMNELERQFLEFLQFNINVPSSVYTKYYFDLRELADAHEISFPLEPLSNDRALKLEAMSDLSEDKIKLWQKTNLTRSSSLDGLASLPRGSKAILS